MAASVNLPLGHGIDERLCVCGHDIHDHEDAEGGTHECTARDCDCQQFKDADDNQQLGDD